jgi:uncharacterized protein DUF2848
LTSGVREGSLDPREIRALVIAGWAGRDAARVDAHVRELEKEGIPRPPRTPMFYQVAPSLLTAAEVIEVAGGTTSGEVECLLVARDDGLWVGLGSDHTDRALERTSVAKSKQMCGKPVARPLWRMRDVAPHWDQLELRSFINAGSERRLYQQGTTAALLHPDVLVAEFGARGGAFAAGAAMFCGTLPTVDALCPAARFEIELVDPVLGRTIRHAYTIRVLPEFS